MPRGFIYKDGPTKEILLALGRRGVLLFEHRDRYGLRKMIKQEFQNLSQKLRADYASRFRLLAKQNLILWTESHNKSVALKLTKHGEHVMLRFKLSDMRLERTPRWDARWRIISYDLPVAYRRESKALSAKLHQLGLYRLQKSLWASPWECLNELLTICTVFNIPFEKYIFYFYAESIPRQRQIMEFFGI